MRYIIVDTPSRVLRAMGRERLAGKWRDAALVMAMLLILLNFIQVLLSYFFFSDIGSLYVLLVSAPLLLGVHAYFLQLFRSKDSEIDTPKPTDLFRGFEFFFKSLGLLIMIGIFVFLWTLLFVFPGMIAILRYSQAFFILADDPEKGIMQCINESKERMYGNKEKLFVLTLSFTGWGLLACLPWLIISVLLFSIAPDIAAVVEQMDYIELSNDFYAGNLPMLKMQLIGLSVLLIPCSLLSAYIYSTSAAFYEIIMGNCEPHFKEQQLVQKKSDASECIIVDAEDGE